MRSEELYEGIGALDEALLERSEKAIEKGKSTPIENEIAALGKRTRAKKSTDAMEIRKARRKKRLVRWLAAAACIALMVTGAGMALDRLGYFRMGCSAYPGTIVDGTYYYWVSHSGVWRYTPEEGSKRIVSAWSAEGFQVNGYGIYYERGRSLYVREHETGKKRLLYRAGLFEGDFINSSLQDNGDLVVTVYNTHKREKYELSVDGITGEVLERLTDIISYDSKELLYSDTHFQLGERQFVIAETEEGSGRYDLLENGKSLLPEGAQLYSYGSGGRSKIGDNLYIHIEYEENSHMRDYLILRPDGNDGTLSVGRIVIAGTNDFLFNIFSNSNGQLFWCKEIATGESWQIELDSDIWIYDMETDGVLAYTCVPWGDAQTCWRLVYDQEGRPVAMELLEEDINKAR